MKNELKKLGLIKTKEKKKEKKIIMKLEMKMLKKKKKIRKKMKMKKTLNQSIKKVNLLMRKMLRIRNIMMLTIVQLLKA
jgi:hypothetical protein